MSDLPRLAAAAREAAADLATRTRSSKDRALQAMASALEAATDQIVTANGRDVEHARASRTPDAIIDRLTLTPSRVRDMAAGLRQIAGSPTPWAR